MIYLDLFAIIFYLLAVYTLVRNLMAGDNLELPSSRNHYFIFGYTALLIHATVLYQNINTIGGLNMGFFNALSLMSWAVSLAVMIAALKKPLENLAIIIFPLTCLALALELFFKSTYTVPDNTPVGLRIHILLSIFAYSLLTIAALQSCLLALQDRQISKKRPASIMRLPPMQLMENLLIQIIIIGFFMLSLSLATGLMFVQDIFAQHLIHKTVLSILAWIIFGTVIWGRWSRGWRGKKIIRWTIGGFLSLMLAYFGSKFVLELILNRV